MIAADVHAPADTVATDCRDQHLDAAHRCVLRCEPADVTVFSASADSDSTRHFDLVACSRCNIVRLSSGLSEQELDEFYRSDYYGAENRKFDDLTEAAVALFVWWRAVVLRRYVPPRGRVLDVGCGRGNFLEVMAQRGYETYGTERSELSAAKAKQRFGDRVTVGELPSASFPENSFDMVTMWHVIEHVSDPLAYVKRAYQLLKPGGAIVLAQPNIDSVQARFGGPLWFHLDVPRHLFHFSPVTIRHLVERAGFSVERISHFSLEQNPFGLLQTFFNLIGRRQNLLYHTLKGDRFGASLPWSSLLRLSYYLLMPFASAITFIESAAGRGGTFYLVARK